MILKPKKLKIGSVLFFENFKDHQDPHCFPLVHFPPIDQPWSIFQIEE